jgi:hypothetical protein
MGAANACSPSARSPLRMQALIRGRPFRCLAVSLARRRVFELRPTPELSRSCVGGCAMSHFLRWRVAGVASDRPVVETDIGTMRGYVRGMRLDVILW